MGGKAGNGSNSDKSRFSSPDGAVPMGSELHSVVMVKSQRPPQGKGTFVRLLHCTATASVLESWIGTGPQSRLYVAEDAIQS